MKISGSKIVVKALQDEGIRFIFGIPGTHNIELYDAMAQSGGIQPILITDEQSAGFMADGVARASGNLAAVNLVPGAGLTHALSGIAECFLDQIPVLVLMCGIRRDTEKAFQLHDIDQAAIIQPLTKGLFQPTTHQELYSCVVHACRLAQKPPHGPVAVEVPAELYLKRGAISEESLTVMETSVPETLDMSHLYEVINELNRAESILLYVGLGAASAGDLLVELAEKLDAIVCTTISGKGVFPENHPRWAWNSMGRAAPPQIRKLIKGCDTVLAIACRFAEVATGSYGFDLPKTLIHVDVDPAVFNRNYPSKIHLIADARQFIEKLLQSRALRNRVPDQEKLLQLVRAHEQIQEKRNSQEGVAPDHLLKGIQTIAGPDTIFVTDSGNGTFLAMEHLRLTRSRSFLAPVDYSCMGYSIPAAIGAKLSQPEKPVAVLVGDGAFLMTGLELATAAHYRAGIVAFLLRDRELSQIAQFQKAALNRKTCTDIVDYDAVSIAKGLNVESLQIDQNHQIKPAVEKAFQSAAHGTPVLIEVAIDYSQPTYFSRGVVATNFLRFSWKERIHLLSRLLQRKFF